MTDRQERIDIAHEAYDRVADQDVGMGTIIEAIVDALDIEPIRPEEILSGMRYEGDKVDEQAVLENRKRVDPELPVEMSDGRPRTITVNHGTWFETADGGCFDQIGKSLTGFDTRVRLRNVA
tara:strand:+ start:5805 stop:6170 length:366 start_codon:yes stop_codon:yes gene_type:complete